MISSKMVDTINEQINAELFSAYLYLAMSAHFEAEGLPGFAKWTRLQAKEETEHAMKFFDFVHDRGGKVTLKIINAPPTSFGTTLQVFEQVLEHERKVTGLINALYETAQAEKDYSAQVLLQWYIAEQVEEEKNATALVDQLRMAGDRPGNLMYIDRHVGKRGED